MEHAFEKVKIVGGIGADDEYWRGLERGEFRLPRCAGCDAWTWPAHYRCGVCGGWEMDWTTLEPRGRIFTWTRTWYPFERVAERAGDVPFVTVVAEIPQAGGARVMGIYEGDRENLKIGSEVIGRILPPSAKAKGYPSIIWAPPGARQ